MVEPNEPLFPAVCSVCGKEVMCEQEVIDSGLIMCSEDCMLTVWEVDDAEDPEPTDEEIQELRRKAREDLEATQDHLLRIQYDTHREDGKIIIPEEAWDRLFEVIQVLIKMAAGPDEDES